MNIEASQLQETRDRFIAQWGVLGTQWGINRTMAQIHALLMTSPAPMSTDEVMEALSISRGNAHTNLKELVGWGLLSITTKKRERKEYFEAEKNVWEIFRRIAAERKRREIDPALSLLKGCADDSSHMTSENGKAFHDQMKALEEFVAFAGRSSERIAALPHGKAIQVAMKLLG